MKDEALMDRLSRLLDQSYLYCQYGHMAWRQAVLEVVAGLREAARDGAVERVRRGYSPLGIIDAAAPEKDEAKQHLRAFVETYHEYGGEEGEFDALLDAYARAAVEDAPTIDLLDELAQRHGAVDIVTLQEGRLLQVLRSEEHGFRYATRRGYVSRAEAAALLLGGNDEKTDTAPA